MSLQPHTLVFGGGGVRVIAFVGVLLRLQELGALKSVTSYYGVSAGALVALLLAAGYPVAHLDELLASFDFGSFQNFRAEVILDVLDTLGADSGDAMVATIRKLLHDKGIDPDITFGRLRETTGNDLHMFATRLNTVTTVEYSAEATPDASVVHALRASMSVPGWLVPVRGADTTNMLVDGGMLNNYPFDCVPADRRSGALGLTFPPEISHRENIDTLADFLEQLVSCAVLPKARRNIRRFYDKTITINIDNIASFDFFIPPDQRKLLVEQGRLAFEAFLERTAK